MSRIRAAIVCAALGVAALLAGPASAQRASLPIMPVAQQTPVWCWAASIEMVFRHYGAPNLNPAGNMQCAVVATLHPACAADCTSCIVSGGSTANMVMSMNAYRQAASAYGFFFPPVGYFLAGRMDFSSIADRVDRGHPLIAGISPSGMGGLYPPTMSEHAVVVVGYDGVLGSVIVNDPYPYPPGFDPYSRAGGRRLTGGQYEIAYAAFAGGLGYKDTIVFSD